MLFNSYVFPIFFVLVYAGYRALPGWDGRKLLLLVASYLFYGWWNPPFCLLLLFSTLVDFYAARRMAVTPNPGAKKALLVISLITNLGALSFFKYGNFFAENFAQFTELIGLQWTYVHDKWDIVLPVGISFYTFQSMSYTIDVYRGKLQPNPKLLDFALYVSFFPQLVAGPIVRASTFLWQTEKAPTIELSHVATGALLCAWGYFKKVVVADNVAGIVNAVFADPGAAGAFDCWAGTYAFAIQIYCDFSGYSDIAIGLALMLGFQIPDNFRRPYGALGFSDFWTRWHISLSSWLRDYLYVSMGGNRRGQARTWINLAMTMLLGGLWHGAAWTFVLWGALHGAYLCIERAILMGFKIDRNWGEKVPLIPRLVVCFIVFHLVCIAWVPFRADEIGHALTMLGKMSLLGEGGFFGGAMLTKKVAVTVAGGALMLWHLANRRRTFSEIAAHIPDRALGVIAGLLFALSILLRGPSNEFIYFQF